jgi:hypothetical protein
MPTLLPTKQILRLAPELGLCVAMGTHDAVAGFLYPGKFLKAPPPDLRTYPGGEGGDFLYCESLSPDGLAFINLLRGE